MENRSWQFVCSFKLFFLFTAFILQIGFIHCASVSTEKPAKEKASTLSEGFKFPPYQGPKKRIQVIKFGISKDIADKYPELTEKRVGWGLCNMVVEGFFDTQMFEYIEEKDEILQKMMNQWKLSESGIIFEDTAVKPGNLKAPEYLVYAEVYDFGVRHEETIVGVAVSEVNTTVIGIQIRMVDVATGVFIPASAMGETKTKGVGIWASVNLNFDQTTVGMASREAIYKAIISLIKRINQP